MILIKGYAEAGALDGEHKSLYRGSCQLIEVKEEDSYYGAQSLLPPSYS